MLEMVERVLAALIILGMLGIVIFLALDNEGSKEVVKVPPESKVVSSTTIEREVVAEPRQNTGREDRQKVVKTVGRLKRSDTYYMERDVTPSRPSRISHRQYDRRYDPYDPWARVDYAERRYSSPRYECFGDWCNCSPNCDKPYWSSSGRNCREYW